MKRKEVVFWLQCSSEWVCVQYSPSSRHIVQHTQSLCSPPICALYQPSAISSNICGGGHHDCELPIYISKHFSALVPHICWVEKAPSQFKPKFIQHLKSYTSSHNCAHATYFKKPSAFGPYIGFKRRCRCVYNIQLLTYICARSHST